MEDIKEKITKLKKEYSLAQDTINSAIADKERLGAEIRALEGKQLDWYENRVKEAREAQEARPAWQKEIVTVTNAIKED